MGELLATIHHESTSTILVHELGSPRRPREVTFRGDEDDALMALHDADLLTVGSTWHRDERTGTRWIEVERYGLGD